jgi:hypothetical protein
LRLYLAWLASDTKHLVFAVVVSNGAKRTVSYCVLKATATVDEVSVHNPARRIRHASPRPVVSANATNDVPGLKALDNDR